MMIMIDWLTIVYVLFKNISLRSCLECPAFWSVRGFQLIFFFFEEEEEEESNPVPNL